MEAVSNSVHSITDLYGADAASRGVITVRIIREDDSGHRIQGFDVEDNGAGFTEDNFRSFRTPDSRLKETRGGKGVGRLAWLKVFNKVAVDSTYDEGGWKRRAFEFRLADRNQIIEQQVKPELTVHRTIVRFREFTSAFEPRCPVRTGIVENRIAAHFVPLFVAGNAPKVTVIDDTITEIELGV